MVSCARHPFTSDPACPGCYPSGVGFTPPPPPVERDTTPAPFGARDALNEQLLEQLAELPIAIDGAEQLELARRQLERVANWYLATYAADDAHGIPLRLVSEASEHYLSDDALDRGAALFEEPRHSLIVYQALLNLARDAGHALGVCNMRGDGLTAAKLRAAARLATGRVHVLERRIEGLRAAVLSLGVGGVTRGDRALSIIAQDDERARET
jgi:hypothetical protein